MNKKIIIIVSVVVILLLAGIFLVSRDRSQNNDFFDKSQFCAKEGEAIGAQGMPSSCCSGLKPLGQGSDVDNCALPPLPTGLSICAPCGDEICNSNYESKCNCPADCAKSKCGKEGETLGGDIDRCCQGLKPKSLSEGSFGGLFECAK